MPYLIQEIEKIKYKVRQKELQCFKIRELEKLLQSPYISNEDINL